MRRFFFLVLLSLLPTVFGGCASKKPRVSVEPKPLPEWYRNPPRSTDTTLYATGEGSERQQAVNDALNRIAAGLSVVIASQYASSITEVRHNGRSDASSTVSNRIQAEVRKIRISDYRVLEETEQGFRHYLVLVRVEKKAIYDGLKNELDRQVGQLTNEERALHTHHALERLAFYRRALREFDALDNSLAVLSVLNPRFDPEPWRRLRHRWQTEALTLEKSIRFSVRAKSPLARRLVPVIREGLASARLSVSDASGKNHFTVTVDTRTEPAEALGFFLARTSVDITVKDDSGRIVGSRRLQLTGQSSQSPAIARQNVAVKLEKVLEKEGIFRLLGLVF